MEVAKLKEKEQQLTDKNHAAQKRVQRTKVLKACSMAGTAVIGSVAIVVFPPALLALPVILPLVTLITEGIELRISKKIDSRFIPTYHWGSL